HSAGFVYSAFFFFVVFCCGVATSKDFSSSGMMRSFGSRCSSGSVITSPSCNSRILPFSFTKIPRAITSYLAIIYLKFTKGPKPLFLLHRSLRAVAVEYSGLASGILANLQTKSRPHEEVKVIVRVGAGCRIGGNRLSNTRTDVHVVATIANEMVASQQEVGANLT